MPDPLDALWAAARASWPDLQLDRPAFTLHVHRRAGKVEPSRLYGSDLYLAAACLAGEAAAVESFDRLFLAPLARQISSRGITREAAEETVQALRVRLLLGDAGVPRLNEYDGRGPLEAWVRVAAVRGASNLRRGEATRARVTEQVDVHRPVVDPELALIQRKYGAVFEAAVAEAMAGLEEEERAALRLTYSHGLNLEGVARALGVSRATAGRRVLSGSQKVREQTLKLLSERIQATPAELESLLGVVRSKLELSLGLLSSW